MAKYTVNYACGHGDHTVDLIGKGSEREKMLSWYESTVVCPDCYKTKKEKEAKEKGLQLIVGLNPFDSSPYPITLKFDGDTKPHKDEIKALGYFWKENQPSGMFGFMKEPKGMCWTKDVGIESLGEELEKAKKINAVIVNNLTRADVATYYKVKEDRKKEADERAERIAAIKKPVCPDCINGAKWNKKVYGKKGNYSFYNDGEKVNLTDEEVDQIIKYLDEKKEYDNTVDKMRYQR